MESYIELIPKTKYLPDYFEKMSKRDDIIIVVKDIDILELNPDGSIGIKTEHNITLPPPSIDSKIITLETILNIKFSLPHCIGITWNCPFNTLFSLNINVKYDKAIRRNATVNNIMIDEPYNIILTRPTVKLDINLNSFNQEKKMGVFRKGEQITCFDFFRRPHPKYKFTNEFKITVFENADLFDQFESLTL